MNRIKEIIGQNKLEEAKKLIEEIEKKLSEEPSDRIRNSEIKKIYELKKLYNEKIQLNTNKIIKKSYENVFFLTKSNAFDGSKEKLVFKNLKNCEIDSCNGLEVSIEKCNNITTKEIQVTNSILIKDVRDSKIIAKASQIRIIGCENIIMIVSTKTGIYLQDSTNIKICPLNKDIDNKYESVYDFNDGSCINYEIMP